MSTVLRRLSFAALLWLGFANTIAAQDYERAQLGVTITEFVASERNGATHRGSFVTHVVPDSPASLTGIRLGDVIVAIDGRTTPSTHALVCEILARRPGDRVQLTIVRASRLLTVAATLARWPEERPGADLAQLNDCGGDRVSSLAR